MLFISVAGSPGSPSQLGDWGWEEEEDSFPLVETPEGFWGGCDQLHLEVEEGKGHPGVNDMRQAQRLQ
jgi:hypothetical protein